MHVANIRFDMVISCLSYQSAFHVLSNAKLSSALVCETGSIMRNGPSPLKQGASTVTRTASSIQGVLQRKDYTLFL